MIASENFASKAVREALGSCLTNKYSEGGGKCFLQYMSTPNASICSILNFGVAFFLYFLLLKSVKGTMEGMNLLTR